MKLLLDTHTFLWLVEGSPKRSAVAQAALCNPGNSLHLIAASVWELAIKTSNKKLTLTEPSDMFVGKWVQAYQIASLPIDVTNALALSNVPEHHCDPFDRILLAQATVEAMTLVNADSKFTSYAVPILW